MTFTMDDWRKVVSEHRCPGCTKGDHKNHVSSYWGASKTQNGKDIEGGLLCRCPKCSLWATGATT